MSNNKLQNEQQKYSQAIADLLHLAKKAGASSAAATANIQQGLTTTVRLGDVESIEFNNQKAIKLTVYKGHKKGSATTNELSKNSLEQTVRAACNIADYMQDDPCADLPEIELMPVNLLDLELYHPWDIDTAMAIEIAKECEHTARNFDSRIINSNGATLNSHNNFYVYGNSHSFIGAYLSSYHSLSCAVIGKSGNNMQTDYDFTNSRDACDLLTAEQVGKKAALRTLERLGSRKIATTKSPVIFSKEVAGSIFNSLLSALSGSNLYKKTSFLMDSLGKTILAKHVNLTEQPLLKKGLASAPFDKEGVATYEKDIIKDGVVESYLLNCYSARKLGMQSTANSGGPHNIIVQGKNDLNLLKKMDTGLLVTHLMGRGVNLTTGDYSRGVSGFWVENGTISYPVEEITIAGNLKDMFKNIIAIGNDVETRGNIFTGAILISEMTIAGN